MTGTVAAAGAALKSRAVPGDVLIVVPGPDGDGCVLLAPERVPGRGPGRVAAAEPVVVVVAMAQADLAAAGVAAVPGDMVQLTPAAAALAGPYDGTAPVVAELRRVGITVHDLPAPQTERPEAGAAPGPDALAVSVAAGAAPADSVAGGAAPADSVAGGAAPADSGLAGAAPADSGLAGAAPAVSLAAAAASALRALGSRPAVVLGAVDPPRLAAWHDLPGVLRGALGRWVRALGSRQVLLAAPRSFCAGVDRAVEIVERALDRAGAPVYVRRQIVHNAHVVHGLQARGAVFVQELDEVPAGATVVLAAHGVAPSVRDEAERRSLTVIDATCPLVAKVHREAKRFSAEGRRIVLVGHEEHEEVEGTVGEVPDRIHVVASADDVDTLEVVTDEPLAYLTQTTLAVDETVTVIDALRRRFPDIVGPAADDICYATQNRQDAVRSMAAGCDLVLVVGSDNSSNSQRLVEVARRQGCRAELVEDETELRLDWLAGVTCIGVTAGASAPEVIVRRLVDVLSCLGSVSVSEHRTAEERVHFALPPQVR
ncbi:MAG: 4-hydroxy-3-methylbut-2-enyl diphosphate reductase [Actinomycetota bacterium]|nr:4-hydroxy-3-methylbut-2-enyl diphosphate reductase [Actinomycetota bacterium]